MLGLRRLKLDPIWLELLPATDDPQADQARINNFQRQLRTHGLAGRYCLLYQKPAASAHELDAMRCIGMSKQALLNRLAGPNALLNLSYSIHPPFLLQFERRIFCDLDPSEIFYWMTKMEMGQWYWGGAVEVNGTFPDLSKKFAFEPYLDLPKRIPEARFELAMNIKADDPERARLNKRGWRIVDPHRVARTPGSYRRYMARALAEFTAIKGVDVAWRTGWLSDRAAAFLALGRPVVTETTGAEKYLPPESGFRFVRSVGDAESAVKEVLCDWARRSREARACAAEVFDSAKNLHKILG